MARTLDDVFDSLPAERRARIEARSEALREEYKTLQDLRKARELTQERMAETLGVKQENISRLEKRSDLLLSTLRSYVAAMGGSLELVAKFPDRPAVSLSSLFEDGDAPAPKRGRSRKPVKSNHAAA